MHADNENLDILILDKGPSDGSDYFTETVEAEFSINVTKNQKNC